MGDVVSHGASVGGLMAMIDEPASCRAGPSLRLSLATRANVPRIEPAELMLPRPAPSRAFSAAHAQLSAERTLRDLARAMGVDCGD